MPVAWLLGVSEEEESRTGSADKDSANWDGRTRRPRADAAGTPSSAQSRVGGTHSVRHSSQWKDGEGGKERVGETWN